MKDKFIGKINESYNVGTSRNLWASWLWPCCSTSWERLNITDVGKFRNVKKDHKQSKIVNIGWISYVWNDFSITCSNMPCQEGSSKEINWGTREDLGYEGIFQTSDTRFSASKTKYALLYTLLQWSNMYFLNWEFA